MLRRFLYLDDRALTGYLSALEDGLRTRSERSSSKASERQLGSAPTGDESELTEVTDTPHARFERLLQLTAADQELAGWIELSGLGDLADAPNGALISVECEIYVPDAVRMLTREGGAMEALDAMSDLLPLAQNLGLDVDGIPSSDEMTAMSAFMSRLSSDLVFVGEEDGSDWKVAGRLSSEQLLDRELEGFAHVVGKVAQRWPEQRWKPLLALPGASLLPRKERKALEAKTPSQDDADEFLEGPAVMLDVLAIYR